MDDGLTVSHTFASAGGFRFRRNVGGFVRGGSGGLGGRLGVVGLDQLLDGVTAFGGKGGEVGLQAVMDGISRIRMRTQGVNVVGTRSQGARLLRSLTFLVVFLLVVFLLVVRVSMMLSQNFSALCAEFLEVGVHTGS